MIENALHLSKHAFETAQEIHEASDLNNGYWIQSNLQAGLRLLGENVEEFSSRYKLLYLKSLLNKISEHDFTYKQLKDMSNDEIFDVILTSICDSSEDEIDKRIERILIPVLELIDPSKDILQTNLIRKLQNNLDIYTILRSLKVKLNSSSKESDLIKTSEGIAYNGFLL